MHNNNPDSNYTAIKTIQEERWRETVSHMIRHYETPSHFEHFSARTSEKMHYTFRLKLNAQEYEVVKRGNRKPQFFAQEKKDRSITTPLPVSLAAPKNNYYPPAYIYNQQGALLTDRLTGLLIDSHNTNRAKNIYPHRIYAVDAHTYLRTIDCDDYYRMSYTLEVNQDQNKLFTSVQALLMHNKKLQEKTHNECEARIEWTADTSCRIGIFADAPTARLQAQIKAHDVNRLIARQNRDRMANNEAKNEPVNIQFYLPQDKKQPIRTYDQEAQEQDVEKNLRSDAVINKDLALFIQLSRANFNFKILDQDYSDQKKKEDLLLNLTKIAVTLSDQTSDLYFQALQPYISTLQFKLSYQYFLDCREAALLANNVKAIGHLLPYFIEKYSDLTTRTLQTAFDDFLGSHENMDYYNRGKQIQFRQFKLILPYIKEQKITLNNWAILRKYHDASLT